MIIFIPKEILTSSNPLRLPISSLLNIRIHGYTKLFLNSANEIMSARMRGKTRRGENRVRFIVWDWQRSHVKVGKKLIVVKCSVARGETLFPFAKNTVEIQISVAGIPLIEKVKMETWRASYFFYLIVILRESGNRVSNFRWVDGVFVYLCTLGMKNIIGNNLTVKFHGFSILKIRRWKRMVWRYFLECLFVPTLIVVS